jgi:quinol monooxygenase YgiN
MRELNGGQPMTKRSEWGEGLLAHIHNVGEDGTVLVVDVWRDQAAMDAFMERLRPVLGEDIADQINVRVFDTNDLVIEG